MNSHFGWISNCVVLFVFCTHWSFIRAEINLIPIGKGCVSGFIYFKNATHSLFSAVNLMSQIVWIKIIIRVFPCIHNAVYLQRRRGLRRLWAGSLQISDTGDYRCSHFQFCPEISPKWRIFSPEFCILGRKLSDRLTFRRWQLPRCHDATVHLDFLCGLCFSV